jgi:large subunit ribosomal protein L14e
LKKKIEEFDLLNRFNSSGVGKRIVKQQKRAALTDFDRFKVMVLKRRLSKAVRTYVNKNRKAILSKAK